MTLLINQAECAMSQAVTKLSSTGAYQAANDSKQPASGVPVIELIE
jgi:hypothetical protein